MLEENQVHSSAQNVEKTRCTKLMCAKVASKDQKVTNRLHVPIANSDSQDQCPSYVTDVRVKPQNLQPKQQLLRLLGQHFQVFIHRKSSIETLLSKYNNFLPECKRDQKRKTQNAKLATSNTKTKEEWSAGTSVTAMQNVLRLPFKMNLLQGILSINMLTLTVGEIFQVVQLEDGGERLETARELRGKNSAQCQVHLSCRQTSVAISNLIV